MQYRYILVLVVVSIVALLARSVLAYTRPNPDADTPTYPYQTQNQYPNQTQHHESFVPASMYYLNANNVWQVSGGPGTAEYMHLQMNAAANANIAPNTDLAFDTVAATSIGGYIVQPTPATITLSAGATYKCTGCVLATTSAASSTICAGARALVR